MEVELESVSSGGATPSTAPNPPPHRQEQTEQDEREAREVQTGLGWTVYIWDEDLAQVEHGPGLFNPPIILEYEPRWEHLIYIDHLSWVHEHIRPNKTIDAYPFEGNFLGRLTWPEDPESFQLIYSLPGRDPMQRPWSYDWRNVRTLDETPMHVQGLLTPSRAELQFMTERVGYRREFRLPAHAWTFMGLQRVEEIPEAERTALERIYAPQQAVPPPVDMYGVFDMRRARPYIGERTEERERERGICLSIFSVCAPVRF